MLSKFIPSTIMTVERTIHTTVLIWLNVTNVYTFIIEQKSKAKGA